MNDTPVNYGNTDTVRSADRRNHRSKDGRALRSDPYTYIGTGFHYTEGFDRVMPVRLSAIRTPESCVSSRVIAIRRSTLV